MAHYKISDVAEEVKDRENNPSESKYDRFVGLEHYVSGDVEITHFGSTERLESAMKVFKAGDILIARRNVYLKRASTVSFDGLTSGDSIVLRAKDPTIARILPFVLNTDDFWDYADQYSDGTMSKRLSPKLLLAYEFDLQFIRIVEQSDKSKFVCSNRNLSRCLVTWSRIRRAGESPHLGLSVITSKMAHTSHRHILMIRMEYHSSRQGTLLMRMGLTGVRQSIFPKPIICNASRNASPKKVISCIQRAGQQE